MVAPKEIERKFIIDLPSIERLKSEAAYCASDIIQIYLESSPTVTRRIRSRRYADKTVYTETKKIRIDKFTSFEDEREISEEDFNCLSEKIRKGSKAIIKRRHSFEFGGHTIEIDVFSEWVNTAIMEIELSSSEEEIILPDFINVKREVSGIREYTNAAFSLFMPPEDS